MQGNIQNAKDKIMYLTPLNGFSPDELPLTGFILREFPS